MGNRFTGFIYGLLGSFVWVAVGRLLFSVLFALVASIICLGVCVHIKGSLSFLSPDKAWMYSSMGIALWIGIV